MSKRADELLNEVEAGRVPRLDEAASDLLIRMVRAGMLHPMFEPATVLPGGVDVVIPVHDHADHVAEAVGAGSAVGPVTVVDDASADDSADRARSAGATVIRRGENGGPAVARNQGAAATTGEFIVFIDADCVPDAGTLEAMLCHFADPALGAVAPRIRGFDAAGTRLLHRFEAARSPIDMGREAGPVRPDARVSFVPTATMAVRREAFDAVGGFDEDLRFGEDVDLVWRFEQAGWGVRYEAGVIARHHHRRRLLEIARRRWAYGTSAGPLAERHPRALAAVRASPWTLAAWLAMALGRPEVATALVSWSWVGLWRMLEPVPGRARLTTRLVGRGFFGAARPLAAALTRSWGPLTVAAILARPALGRRLVVLVAAGMAMEWWERRPDLDPITFSAMAVVDDLLFCGGVWEGCARSGRLSPLLPRTGRARVGDT